MSHASIRLAAVDSDSGFLRVLANRVDGAGHSLRMLDEPASAGDLAAMGVDAVVLDVALIGATALEYVRDLREGAPGLGIVVCTAPSSVAERVRGLRLGADDWVSKPCHPEEVVARVEAVVRRHRSGLRAGSLPVTAGELEVRADQFQAFVAGRNVDLTRREYELVQLLAEAQGKVLPREEIYQRVWGYAMAHGDRSVDVFVRKLRQKLEAASPGWKYIHTHFGIGYRFEPEPRDDAETPAPVETAVTKGSPAAVLS